MYCTKCKFNSFDHLPKCPKCGFDWKEDRDALQLSWLQSAGYDWFQHAPSQPSSVDRIDPAPDESTGFVFSDDDPARMILEPSDEQGDVMQGPLLIDEVPLADLPEEMEVAAPDTMPGGSEIRTEILPEEYDIQLEPDGIPVNPLLHEEPEVVETDPAFEQSPIQEQPASEDVLAAWEIPDDLIAPDPIVNGSESDEKGPAPNAPETTAEDQELTLTAEIDYDFSSFEIETPESSNADADKHKPEKTPEGPDQPSFFEDSKGHASGHGDSK